MGRQHDIAEADADQPANGDVLRLPQAADNTVAALAEGDVVPVVGTLAAGFDNSVEMRRTIFQFHALFEPF